ncbi:MAG: hypothetical protein OEV92_08920 [Nitrospinota bacterium]|nr:hypothetical protein [Nitrospinota bacterium]
MRFFNLNGKMAIIPIILIAGAISCGVTKKTTAPKNNNNQTLNTCGPTHEMAGHTVVWEKSQCDKADTMYVDQNTVDDKGRLLGTTEVSHGMVSVKYHGLLNENIAQEYDAPIDNYGVFFKAFGWDVFNPATGTTKKGEVNWWFMAARYNENAIQTWFGMQRFDGVCSGWCESKDWAEWNLQFQDPTDIVQFDCGWSYTTNPPDGFIWCDVKKTNSGEVYHYENSMLGPYTALEYIGVGSKAYDGPRYPSFPGPVSEFKVTIFN